MMKVEVDIECRSCGGTGLYCGMAEPKGTAVVCLSCGGTGCENISYTPFTKRKHKPGVHTVSLSRGCLIAFGVGAGGKSISYNAFVNGLMPTK